jgi:hypothetical protein
MVDSIKRGELRSLEWQGFDRFHRRRLHRLETPISGTGPPDPELPDEIGSLNGR